MESRPSTSDSQLKVSQREKKFTGKTPFEKCEELFNLLKSHRDINMFQQCLPI
jgi:hypothetical protein